MSLPYRVPVLETFTWQLPVKGRLATPPVGPTKGDRYLVTMGLVAWLGHDNEIAYWDGAVWKYTAPSEGFKVWINNEDLFYVYNGSAWNTEFVSLVDEFYLEVMG